MPNLVFNATNNNNNNTTNSLCAESEQIGAHTMEHMGRQREQLERSAGLIQQSLENTEQARLILKEM